MVSEKQDQIIRHTPIGFREAFSEKGARVIAEIKPKTPLSTTRTSPSEIFENIEKSGINPVAYSILIDKEHFGGDVKNIEIVRGKNLPVLYKEFVVSRCQINEAMYYGYSAILFIKKCFPEITDLKSLIAYAIENGIEPLVEVDNESDLDELLSLYTHEEISIGINCRDLSTLEINKHFHFSIYEKFKNKLKDYIVFAFSGIESMTEIEKYLGKYNGVLIGGLFRKSESKIKDTVINPAGYFGEFGGQYLPEMLIPIIEEIREGFFRIKDDPIFQRELHELYKNFVGRPSPLVHCKHLSESLGGGQIYIKNEGVNHTGAHKINHCIGQILLAKYLGKKRIIAETGAGQHGLATASVAAKFGLECVIYMGKKDYDRQRPNVYYMELAGATVIPVTEGAQTLRNAVNAAMKDLINHPNDTYYLLGTACGPNPYPAMNVFFQKIIGEEVRTQLKDTIGKPPDILVACVGGGSNAQGLFHEFLDDKDIKMIGVEAGGRGITSGEHAARFSEKQIGVVEGYKSYFLQNPQGQIRDTYSISAGLDYSGVSPQIAYLESIGRIEMCSATDQEALDAIQMLMRTEGILSALESAHAVAEAIKIARDTPHNTVIVCNLSGRGDKDLFITAPRLDTGFKRFLEDYLLTI